MESLRSTLDLPGGFTFGHDGGFTFHVGNRRTGDRRYHQHLIRPGEEAYVFGTVQLREVARSADNAENLVSKRVPREDRDLEPLFMIADHEATHLARSRRWALLRFPVGAFVFTAGLGGLLYVGSLILDIDIQVFSTGAHGFSRTDANDHYSDLFHRRVRAKRSSKNVDEKGRALTEFGRGEPLASLADAWCYSDHYAGCDTTEDAV